MKQILLLLLCVYGIQNIHAQKKENAKEKVQYVGGNYKLSEDIKKGLSTDITSLSPNGQEYVFNVAFTVDKEGKTKDISVDKIKNDSLKEEIKMVINNLTTWQPVKGETEIEESRLTIPFVINGHPATVEKMDKVITIPDIYSQSDEVYELMSRAAKYKTGIQDFTRRFKSYAPLGIEGNAKVARFIVGFVVEKDGTLTEITIIKSSGDDYFDKAVVKAVKRVGNWVPAKQNQLVVRSKITMPMTLQLE